MVWSCRFPFPLVDNPKNCIFMALNRNGFLNKNTELKNESSSGERERVQEKDEETNS